MIRSHHLTVLSSLFKRTFSNASLRKAVHLSHPFILAIEQGQGLIGVDGKFYSFKAGQFYSFPANTRVEWQLESATVDCFLLFYKPLLVYRRGGSWDVAPGKLTLEQSTGLPLGRLTNRPQNDLASQTAQLFEVYKTNPRQDQLQHQFLLLIEALKSVGLSERAEINSAKSMELSIGYIHEHFADKITLQQLSALAGMTPTSYSRSFKRANGISPMQYVHQVRLDKAKQLLTQCQVPIPRIATQVGFEHEDYFRRSFKASTGLTPAYYQKRSALRIALVSCMISEQSMRGLGVPLVAAMNLYDAILDTSVQGGVHPPRKVDVAHKMQQLQQAKPDLIITDFRHQPYLSDMRAIAQVAITAETTDWRNSYTQIAEWVGKEKTALQQMSQLDRSIEQLRMYARHTIGAQAISVMRLIYDDVRIQGMVNHPLNDLLYSQIGLLAGEQVPAQERLIAFSPAQLPELHTDILLIYQHPSFARHNQEWAGLRSVPKQTTFFIPNWIAMSWTPVGQSQIIERLLEI